MIASLLWAAMLLSPSVALAWQGYDTDSGEEFQVQPGQLPNRDLSYSNTETGQTHQGQIESSRELGTFRDIQIRDQETGEERTLRFNTPLSTF